MYAPTRKLLVLAAFTAVLTATFACSSDDSSSTTSTASTTTAESTVPSLPDELALPIVFVHGFAGSAQQYESQAIRFAQNGYPQDRIVAYEHDGAGMDIAGYTAGLAEFVDATLAELGAEQVYLVGHSRGTFVSSTYLGDPTNAAKVAKYVALDGQPCPDVDVPCREITQDDLPGQAHVEVATSPESFAMQFEYLLDSAPDVVDIVPREGTVTVEGRAVNFPANTGRADARLAIWAIDAETGARRGGEPHATFDLDAEGYFGPVEIDAGAHYEWLLSAPQTPVQHHLYLQPYFTDSRLVRLLSSDPDGPTRSNTNAGADHSSLIAIRMREWYGEDDPDLDGDERDVLEVGVDDGEPANVAVERIGNGTIGLHVHDDMATPGATTLGPLPYFSEQPFQNGIDVYLPASEPPDGTITVRNVPRGDTSRPQVLRTPNWPSADHAISVVFTDYPVD